jgi:tRNA (cytidine/uridine-2'-O-)-methyltransferase
MHIALYQPEIPGNVGAVLRLSACFGVAVDLIEPLGFGFSDKRLKRAGMDYADRVAVTRHADWDVFRAHVKAQPQGRIVLLSSKATSSLFEAQFLPGDTLLMGSESAGVPEEVRAQVDLAVRIPLMPGLRSLNLGVATGIALAEALRQTGGLPKIGE